ncbi:hypothetical protein JVU11DRAFT_8890 [Chiua virens]|nr:hypothetical protein JVU11DRAFT_8890 [Chiua virens]
MPKKLLDAREFVAQIFNIAANVVLSKLATIGLTVENIKKLENLGKILSLVEGGLQVANIIDAVMHKLAGVSLMEECIKKLVNLEQPVAAGEDLQAARMFLHMVHDSDNLEYLSSESSSLSASKPTQWSSVSSLWNLPSLRKTSSFARVRCL